MHRFFTAGIYGHKADRLRGVIAKDRASLLMKWADAVNHPALQGRRDEEAYARLLEHLQLINDKQAAETLVSINSYLKQQGSALKHLDRRRHLDMSFMHMTLANRNRPIRTDRSIEKRYFKIIRITAHLHGFRRFAVPAFWDIFNTPRVLAWSAAWDAFKERPVFGWGPNNFAIAFNKYYRPRVIAHGWGESWSDDAHNVPLNTLVEQGLLGLLSYLLLMVTPVLMVCGMAHPTPCG